MLVNFNLLFMKKILFVLFLALVSAVSALAVPPGVYCDNRGKHQVLIQGDQIHFLDSDGYVTRTLYVIKENSDGSFTTKESSTGIEHSRNGYWYENGVLYLNLEWGTPVTRHRK